VNRAEKDAGAAEPALPPHAAEPTLIPVAIGELADKITILEIKSERIANPDKLRNIHTELRLLRDV
jgi:hypothetical protein